MSIPSQKFASFIVNKADDRRLVYGIVYEPNVVDGQGDFADADAIEKACHKFMTNWQKLGLMHKRATPDLKLVECYIAPVDFHLNGEEVTKGSWVIGVHVDNERIWEAVRAGKLTGFSLQGFGRDAKKPAASAA